jgi:hypothetical protein
VANRIIEELRSRVPYIRRLHCQIDELRHRLAAVEATPWLEPVMEAHPAEEFRRFLRCLQPHDVPGFAKRRFGAARDGGYIMLDDFGSARQALSLGIGNDVSWDLDMAARGFRVFQYDPTVDASPEASPHFDFRPLRVVGRRRAAADVTLAEIMERPELASDRDVIAKIDIDESEWEVLANADTAVLRRIRQIAVEFGEIRRFVDRDWRALMLAAVANVTATHACIHVHGNNWGPFTVIGGIPFPNFFEVTFVRRSDYRLVPSSASFPTAIDRPNNPKKPDFHLGRWDY